MKMSKRKRYKLKTQIKHYKGIKLTKYTDGSVFMESPKKMKGLTKYHRGQPYVGGLDKGGFRKAKKYIDKRKK